MGSSAACLRLPLPTQPSPDLAPELGLPFPARPVQLWTQGPSRQLALASFL